MDSMDLYIQMLILGFIASPCALSSTHQHGKRMPWSPGQIIFLRAGDFHYVTGRLVLFGTPTTSKRWFHWIPQNAKDPDVWTCCRLLTQLRLSKVTGHLPQAASHHQTWQSKRVSLSLHEHRWRQAKTASPFTTASSNLGHTCAQPWTRKAVHYWIASQHLTCVRAMLYGMSFIRSLAHECKAW